MCRPLEISRVVCELKHSIEVRRGTNVGVIAVVSNPPIPGGEPSHSLVRVVRGRVIGDHDLEVREGLRHHFGQQRINRDAYGDPQRCCHYILLSADRPYGHARGRLNVKVKHMTILPQAAGDLFGKSVFHSKRTSYWVCGRTTPSRPYRDTSARCLAVRCTSPVTQGRSVRLASLFIGGQAGCSRAPGSGSYRDDHGHTPFLSNYLPWHRNQREEPCCQVFSEENSWHNLILFHVLRQYYKKQRALTIQSILRPVCGHILAQCDAILCLV
jgi:hypothetical protein